VTLDGQTRRRQESIQHHITERNARILETEAEKLDSWAEDLKLGLEREIKELDRQIREVRRATTAAPTLEQKLTGQKQIRALETKRAEKRRSLFDAQDQVDKQRDDMIANIEGKLVQGARLEPLMLVRWKLI